MTAGVAVAWLGSSLVDFECQLQPTTDSVDQTCLGADGGVVCLPGCSFVPMPDKQLSTFCFVPAQVGDETMSVLEIWGAEYQENDCLLIKPESRDLLQAICDRERCLMQVSL